MTNRQRAAAVAGDETAEVVEAAEVAWVTGGPLGGAGVWVYRTQNWMDSKQPGGRWCHGM